MGEFFEKKSITASTMKIIAMAAMLLDHVAVVFIGSYMAYQLNWPATSNLDDPALQRWMSESGSAGIFWTYYAIRLVGRLAFPLFAFMLFEGFMQTSSRGKYLLRILILALISEVPYDLAMYGSVWDIRKQNTCFTLFLGLSAMIVCDLIKHNKKWTEKPKFRKVLGYSTWIVMALISLLMGDDYGFFGVLSVFAFWSLRSSRIYSALFSSLVLFLSSQVEMVSAFAAIPLALYKGEKGIGSKWFKYGCYAFYPLHLLILFAVAKLLGVY